ncbi:MAG: inositol monophosphatase [Pirellulales bacterium]|nr:inositol monophosphatase [Pirellulales bacterium]
MPALEDLLAVCSLAAEAGAAELMAWRGRFESRQKSPRDLVTDADLASQQAIHRVIRSRYPEHGFLGEESPDPEQLCKPYCWVVDPLDGTTNYVHDFPCFAVSVAVACDGQLMAATILDPLRGEVFSAAKGQGAHLNGSRIAVSRVASLGEALVAISLPPELESDSPDFLTFLRVAPHCQAVRRTGSAALNLAYVACGRLDAHWAHFIHPWDSAAGILLVREAGGIATASQGGEYQLAAGNYFVASQAALYQALQGLVMI